MSEVVTVTNMESFEKLLASGKPTLVDFYATWCGPCQMILPIYSQFSSEYGNKDKANIVKVDIDQGMDIAEKYSVMSVPTFLIFDKSGNLAETLVGMRNAAELGQKLDQLV